MYIPLENFQVGHTRKRVAGLLDSQLNILIQQRTIDKFVKRISVVS